MIYIFQEEEIVGRIKSNGDNGNVEKLALHTSYSLKSNLFRSSLISRRFREDAATFLSLFYFKNTLPL